MEAGSFQDDFCSSVLPYLSTSTPPPPMSLSHGVVVGGGARPEGGGVKKSLFFRSGQHSQAWNLLLIEQPQREQTSNDGLDAGPHTASLPRSGLPVVTLTTGPPRQQVESGAQGVHVRHVSNMRPCGGRPRLRPPCSRQAGRRQHGTTEDPARPLWIPQQDPDVSSAGCG